MWNFENPVNSPIKESKVCAQTLIFYYTFNTVFVNLVSFVRTHTIYYNLSA